MKYNEAYNFLADLAMKAVPTEVVDIGKLNEALLLLDGATKILDKVEAKNNAN